MRRTPLVAGNWKMNLTNPEAMRFARSLVGEPLSALAVEVVLLPPFTALAEVALVLSGSRISLGGQDLHWERAGAFTGEISAAMLRSVSCEYVLVGHSERRRHFGESPDVVARKTSAALDGGLVPVVCVGESREEREAGRTESVLEAQVSPVLERILGVPGDRLVFAYEPVWAIGTGVNATPAQAQEAHAWLRARLRRALGAAVEAVRLLYGGSVTPENGGALLGQPEVDGVLVGGASLDAPSFAAIVRAAAVPGSSPR